MVGRLSVLGVLAAATVAATTVAATTVAATTVAATTVAATTVAATTVAATTAAATPVAATTAVTTAAATPAVAAPVPPSQVAAADAAALLPLLILPPGAAASSGPPAGAGPALVPPSIAPATPNLATSVAYWTVPGTPAAVIAYVAAHPPAGGRFSGSGFGGQYGVITSRFEGFDFPATKILAQRSLGLTAVALSPTTSAVLAEAADVWLTPRPASERVPSAARLATVTIVTQALLSEGPHPPPLTTRRIRVTDRAKVRRLIAAVDALPAAQPGTIACPAGNDSKLTISFRASAGSAPLAVAEADTNGCGGVSFTLHGHTEPPLSGGFTLLGTVDRILGIRAPTA
jgi:hypothetical protein